MEAEAVYDRYWDLAKVEREAALNWLCMQTYPLENGSTITRLPRLDQRGILEALKINIPRTKRM
jgi:hypothetical protein